jgi:hypothetical protein
MGMPMNMRENARRVGRWREVTRPLGFRTRLISRAHCGKARAASIEMGRAAHGGSTRHVQRHPLGNVDHADAHHQELGPFAELHVRHALQHEAAGRGADQAVTMAITMMGQLSASPPLPSRLPK